MNEEIATNSVRDAATIVLIRRCRSSSFVLMGKRNPNAVFMPKKYVFPGGAWDEADAKVPVAKPIGYSDQKLLQIESKSLVGSSLPVTAVRELWEETGLKLASPIKGVRPPKGWDSFFKGNKGPDLSNLRFFFRAITPPGRSRRFDARFFFCDAEKVYNDLDDFSKASSELHDLRWVNMKHYNQLAIPKITSLVLDHLKVLLRTKTMSREVLFFSGGSQGLRNKVLKVPES